MNRFRPRQEAAKTPERQKLNDLLAESLAVVEAMSPEEQEEMWQAQRESWVRGEMVLSKMERETTRMHRPSPTDNDLASRMKAAEETAERYRNALVQILRYSDCRTARRYAAGALFISERMKGVTS